MQENPDRILVVEDDDNIRRILGIQLEGAGYDVITAEDGEAALRVLQSETPDLVLLDVMMPHMDGFTVCRKIRADHRHAQLPVIFLTAKTGQKARVEGLLEGANDYVEKPYEADELIARVKNLIAWGRAQRHSNPLTGLPGNVSIEKEVDTRLAGAREFAFLYLDLDNFKAFNDHYSYMAGDGVIRLLAQVLQDVVRDGAHPDDFVGHVGGDDFVVITGPDRCRAIAEEVIRRFDQDILQHYRADDRERGYVVVANRQGVEEHFPLVSVTIALIRTSPEQISHAAALEDRVAELKKLGKQSPGSVVVEDRRGGDAPQLRTGSDG